MENVIRSAFQGKRVLVTGHTGFKGSWLSIWLHAMGAKVIGVALDPATDRDNFVLSGIGQKIEADIRADIRDRQRMLDIFRQYQPEVVFHLAAQPLVRLSYDIPVETYETNVMGSIHIMEAIRHTDSVRAAVMITTDKCYENREQIWGYRENEPMGGYDPSLPRKVLPRSPSAPGVAASSILLITARSTTSPSPVFVPAMW